MMHTLLMTIMLAAGPAEPPACWIRGDPADLELRISHLDSVSTTLGGDTVKVCYSRPRALGRPIMGRLVPFGEPWRLGANEATVLHTPVALVVGDVTVPAGSYSLYAVPGPEMWRLVVNGEPRRWGVPITDAVRAGDVDMTSALPVEELATRVERFTMRFEREGQDTAVLVMEWERTRVRVHISQPA